MAAALDPDEVLRSTTGKANFQRLTRLLISGGTTLLREIFDIRCLPSDLPKILSNPATKKQLKSAKLTKPQWDCLYPSPGVYGTSADFDVTLLFRLLRTICNLIPPPTGWDALPAGTDHSLAADLARIKYYRNSVYGHVNQEMEITDERFPSLWEEIREALVGIAGQISFAKKWEWQVAIDKFLKDPLTAEDERNVQELLMWYKNDMELKKSVEELNVATQGISQGIERLGTVVREQGQDIGEQLAEIHQAIHRLSSGIAVRDRHHSAENSRQEHDLPCITSSVKSTKETSEMQHKSWYFDQGMSTESENDDVRRIRPKTYQKNPREVLESRRREGDNGPPSSLKSEIEKEDDQFGTNSSAKGTFLHEREIYPSSFHKGPYNGQSRISSDGMLPTTSAGVAKTQTVSAPCQRRLAERMRLKSKKIKNQRKEFGSIYKLPTEETMRLDEKMIAKNILKNELHGVSSAQERRKEKVLLVMGATGAGKSTLINGMVNYIMGVEWEDEFRFKLVAEESSLSQTKSGTKEITAYTIHPMEGSAIPYVLTIVDTPGFGDTEGVKRDVFITKQIKEFFSLQPPDGIDHLDGIGFVTQSALPRLTPTQKYIFDSILAIFGKDVENNFFMMVTFSDGQEPPVLEAIKDAQISYQSSFKFNNSAVFAKNKKGFDKLFWEMGRRSFEEFFAKFGKTNCVSLNLTKKVLKEREHLEALVEGINPQIKKGLAKIEEVRQVKLILEEHKRNIEDNKHFEYFVDVMKTNEIDLGGTGIIVKEKRTFENLKQRYDMAVSGKSRVEGILQQLTEHLRQLRIQVLTNMYEVRLCLHHLDEIALKPDPLTEVKYIELLIEKEKQEAREGFMDRVRDLKQVKSKVKILSKVKSVDDIPNLVDQLMPVDELETSIPDYKPKLTGCIIS